MRVLTIGFSLLGCVVFTGSALAQTLYFYAKPFEVFEGDAVVFNYLPVPPARTGMSGRPAGLPLSQIKKWKWDFNGDGVWDEQKEVAINDVTIDQINATWIATFNAGTATGGTIPYNTYTPRLQITTMANVTLPVQVGVTEDVFGLDGGTDATIKVKKRSIANSQIRVNFSVNPRLALPLTPVKFYPDITFADGVSGQVTEYHWDLNGDGSEDSTSPNPSFTYPNMEASYNVSLTVFYTVAGSGSFPLTETKMDLVHIQPVDDNLALGRAYRRGFPETYGWDDIISAYSALGVGNNRYVYFNHFEDAFFVQQSDLLPSPDDPAERQVMAEVVNELLQGQSLTGNQRLIEALRIKYPRMDAYDPANPPIRLPAPTGTREETEAIETAILDLHAPIRYAAVAIRSFGTDILRAGAPAGEEPFPQFPQYLSFLDPTLSQAPIPIKNEYWQFGGAFERMALGRVEKAKKLFRLSAQDETARVDAKEECKVAGIQSYLGMAVLAAGQTEREFQSNEGNLMLAHLKNARDLFETINAGLNPLGNDGSFVPNESFTAIFQDAQESVADAREAEINARQEDRTYDHYQADLRNEQQSQRASFITPLTNLTGVDPALYNDLKTVDDQNDYRNTIRTRVNALLASYPNANPAGTGEYGSQVIGVLDSQLAIEQSVNRLNNLVKSIEISQWANTQVDIVNGSATAQLRAHDIARGYANGITLSTGVSGIPPFPFISLSVNSGAIISGYLNADDRDVQALQSAQIADIQLEEQTRKSLLEIANLVLDIRRAKNAYDQQKLRLDQLLSQMDRLIEDLAHARETASSLYFQDPSFRVVVSEAQRRADAETDFAVDRLYRLAKTLEYEWAEAYQNPIIIPVSSQEPASLENPLFDKFTKIDSLFFIRGGDEAKDYLDALKAWDSKVRRINVTSVRGPNHSGPISAEPISMREQILGLKPNTATGFTLEASIQAFRNYLETKRVANYYNVANPSLEIEFATEIEDNALFPATGSRWNMRIASIAADIYAESGFSDKQVAEIDLIQTGMVSLRRFFAEPPAADDLFRLTFNADNLNRTAFAIAFPSRINGASGGRPELEFTNLGLADRPIAATKWILRINTENPTNRNINFSKIKDIVLRFTYTYGNPPEFTGF